MKQSDCRVARIRTSPQPLRWLAARPASAGLCVFGRPIDGYQRAGLRISPLAFGEYGRELTRAERRRADLLEERWLKRTASARERVRVVEQARQALVRADDAGVERAAFFSG